MYDVTNGKLQSLHNNIFQEDGGKSEITKFKIDKRHRKAYVANSQGQVFVVRQKEIMGFICHKTEPIRQCSFPNYNA